MLASCFVDGLALQAHKCAVQRCHTVYEDFDHSSSQQLWQPSQQGLSKQDKKECNSAQPFGLNLHLVIGTPAKTPPSCPDPLTQGHQSLH